MINNESITRSGFLRNGLKSIFEHVVESVKSPVKTTFGKMITRLHRPPGAVDELTFLLKCTRCDRCIEACPHNALKRADIKYGAAAGTPVIEPKDSPCYLCTDYPCIKSCPEDALLASANMKMGTAQLIHNRCFAYNGQICDYCYTQCPGKDKSIIMNDGKPVVIENACTGCGICEYLCPAPGKAIMILPEKTVEEI